MVIKMLENYKVQYIKDEPVLYLFLSMKYEFAKDLEESSLKKTATNLISENHISFAGDKVVFVIDGIISNVVRLDNHTDDQKVIIQTEASGDITLHDALLSVLFSNIKMDLQKEALQAIIVLYRSELLHFKRTNKKLKRYNEHFSYLDINYYKIYYPKTFDHYKDYYEEAIRKTNGEYLIYEDEPIKAYLHIASNGYTESSKEIPYLVQKESLWDLAYPYYFQVTHFSVEELKKRLTLEENNYEVKITKVSHGNRIESLQIGNKEITKSDFVTKLHLPSSDATILVEADGLTFITRGVGDGYGLSLSGANALAKLNCNYRQILGYYFQKVQLVTKQKKAV